MTALTAASIAVEEALLMLKAAFLVLLYLFIWRIVRTASRDLRLPQESMVLPPHQARQLIGRSALPTGRLVVLASPAIDVGTERVLDSAPITVGRGQQNDVQIERDDFASARHARFEPRRDGVWVEDAGSTNGTYVNGARLSQARRLRPGDVVRIGQTDLRFEQ
ncbi:MAG: FHA domain-containing protein [Gaiellaceae bacterium]